MNDYDDNRFDTDEPETRRAPVKVAPLSATCTRRVQRGRKNAACGDETRGCLRSRCSNCCDDAECGVHGHYRRR